MKAPLASAPLRTPTLGLALLGILTVAACKSRVAATSDAGSHDAAAPALSAGLPAPADVGAPPGDATRTPSGLAYKVLAPGTGTEHPGQNDGATVNFTGWTTDGKMFESTVAPTQPGRKPAPANLSLNRVIPGWTEALQLMVVGEKARFWIPEALAYNHHPGAPAGMVVFDMELLGFTPGPKPPADVAAPPADASRAKDGLASEVTQKGTGTVHPKADDGVRVNYSIWQADGRLLDASKDKPAVRPVSGDSVGWSEGVELMVVGEKRTLWVPSSLGPVRPGTTTPDVTMEVELLDILPAPKTPGDVKGPPRDAVVQKDGLASKVLAKGTGTAFPTPTSSVTVNYAGWTIDGKLFDSSYTRGEPATFGLANVIPGWTEGLQLMVEGEKRRFWVPEALAYKGKPQGPQGMLVFDVELLRIGAPPQPRAMPGMGGMGGMGGGMNPMGGGGFGHMSMPPRH